MMLRGVTVAASIVVFAAVGAVGSGGAVGAVDSQTRGQTPAADTLTLALRYQAAHVPVAVTRLPGTKRVRVPLVPHSQPIEKGLPLGIISPTPGTPYLRSADSPIYQVNQPMSVVQQRVRQYFIAHGDREVSSGSSGSPRGQEFFVSFAKGLQDPVNYGLTTYSPSPGVTRYAYFVTDVAVPARPAYSRIPLALRSMRGTIRSQSVRSVSSTNPQALKRLAQALNGLNRIQAGVVHCPAVFKSADLVLVPKDGPSIPVHILSGCSVTIGKLTLQDYPAAPVWKALTDAASHTH